MKIKYAFYKADAPHASWKDKVIALWTKGPYSHMEIIIDDYMYSSSPRDGHVRKKPHNYDKLSWDYITVTLPKKDVQRILEFFEKTEGHKYDWLGIVGFVLPIHDSEKKYFCSEWDSKGSIIGGVSCFYDKNPSRISPNRAAEILIEEGGYEFD